MSLSAIDHINIVTAKLEETRAFFVDVLGLEEGYRPDFSFPGHWLYANGEGIVHLVGTEAARQPSETAALDHFAFAAQDYDAVIARLEAHNVTFVANEIEGAGIRQLFLRDPNGVTIELNFKTS